MKSCRSDETVSERLVSVAVWLAADMAEGRFAQPAPIPNATTKNKGVRNRSNIRWPPNCRGPGDTTVHAAGIASREGASESQTVPSPGRMHIPVHPLNVPAELSRMPPAGAL